MTEQEEGADERDLGRRASFGRRVLTGGGYNRQAVAIVVNVETIVHAIEIGKTSVFLPAAARSGREVDQKEEKKEKEREEMELGADKPRWKKLF